MQSASSSSPVYHRVPWKPNSHWFPPRSCRHLHTVTMTLDLRRRVPPGWPSFWDRLSINSLIMMSRQSLLHLHVSRLGGGGGRRQRGPFRVCCGVNLHIDKLVCRSDFTSALPHAPWRNAVGQKFNLLQEPPFLCPPTTPPVNLWTPHSLLNILYIFALINARELSHSRG